MHVAYVYAILTLDEPGALCHALPKQVAGSGCSHLARVVGQANPGVIGVRLLESLQTSLKLWTVQRGVAVQGRLGQKLDLASAFD